jgi:hypothetical protein
MTGVIKRERKRRWERRDVSGETVRLTSRDARMVAAIAELGFATVGQICELVFGGRARSNCQRRFTFLHVHGYVDKVPGRAVNQPDVYCLTRNVPAGLRLLRLQNVKDELVRRPGRNPQLEHVLAINDVRCALSRAARAGGLELALWQGQRELAPMAQEAGFVPDGFAVLRRNLPEGRLASSLLIEVERSPRRPRAVLRKFARIRELHESGFYTQRFGRRSLRLLVLTSHMNLDAEERWARTLCGLAERAGLSFARFASLRRLLGVAPGDLFGAAIWWRPGAREPDRLGEIAVSEGLRSQSTEAIVIQSRRRNTHETE